MRIQLELAPEVESRLLRDAEARGMSLGEYASSLLAEAGAGTEGSGPMTPERAERFLREMAEGGEHLPMLPDDAFTRASIYQDHN